MKTAKTSTRNQIRQAATVKWMAIEGDKAKLGALKGEMIDLIAVTSVRLAPRRAGRLVEIAQEIESLLLQTRQKVSEYENFCEYHEITQP